MMGRSPLQEVILLHTGWNEGPGHLEGTTYYVAGLLA